MKLSMNMIGKKRITFKNLKIDDTIDLSFSGYAAQLFSIFNNNSLFCFQENYLGKKILGNYKRIAAFYFY
jgi:hypothetical protein